MEGDKSESQEDNQISPKKSTSLEETVEGLQQCINEILEKIKQDKSFSEITAEGYDQKKIYLTTHLTELSQMYNVLVELVLSPGGSGFLISGAEVDDVDILLKKRFNLAEEIVSLIKKIEILKNKNLKSKKEEFDKQTRIESAYDAIRVETEDMEIEDAKVVALQKQVSDLLLVTSNCNHKLQTLGEELDTSEKKLSVSNGVISNLKRERSNLSQEKQKLQDQVQSFQPTLKLIQDRNDSEVEKVDEIQERLANEISVLKGAYQKKEDLMNADIEKLEMEVKEKCDSVDDLNNKIDVLMLEKDEVKAKIDTLEAEKSTRDNLIRELQTRLDSLQVENVRVVSSFDGVKEVTNELKLKVVELETEVDKQKGVLQDGA